MKLEDLISLVKQCLAEGMWNPDDIHLHISEMRLGIHYSTIRKAIHLAKSGN